MSTADRIMSSCSCGDVLVSRLRRPEVVVGIDLLRQLEVVVLVVDRIEEVKSAFEAGRSFAEVAKEFEVKDDGEWRTFTLSDGNLDSLNDLKKEVREALIGLEVDQATIPIEGRTSTTWYSVLGFIVPPSRTIFEPGVQLTIRNRLESIRYDDEERKYLDSLRRRWVNDEIKKMELRLIDIALRRYWQN